MTAGIVLFSSVYIGMSYQEHKLQYVLLNVSYWMCWKVH